MKKKGLCLALVAMLLFTQSGVVVYAESIYASQEAINNIEKITGTSDINADIYEIEEDKIIVDGTDAIIEIPYDADEELTIDDGEGRKVSMNLPAEVMDTEGILSDDGTVLYDLNEGERLVLSKELLGDDYDTGEVLVESGGQKSNGHNLDRV